MEKTFRLEESTVDFVSESILKAEHVSKEILDDFVKENYDLVPDPWAEFLVGEDAETLPELHEIHSSLLFLLRPLGAVMERNESLLRRISESSDFDELRNSVDEVLETELMSDRVRTVLLQYRRSRIPSLVSDLEAVKRWNSDAFRILGYLNGLVLASRRSILEKFKKVSEIQLKLSELKMEEEFGDYLNVEINENGGGDDDDINDEDDSDDDDDFVVKNEEDEDFKPRRGRKRDPVKAELPESEEEDEDLDLDVEKETPFKCEDCGKFYQDEYYLNVHLERIHGKGKVCRVCKAVLNDETEYTTHMNEKHDGITEKQCHICKKEFANKPTLRKHIQNIHTLNNKCDECGECFRTKHKLKSHVRKVHTPKPKEAHPCEHCGKIFKTRDYMRTHVKFVHERYRVVLKAMCDLCGKKFENNWRLKKHREFIHEGVRPFKCEICQRGFIRSDCLKSHIAVTHEGKKEFKCDKCGKDFAHLSSLQTHVRAEHEGGAYPCHYCGKVFSRSCGLWKHTRNMHERKTPKVKVVKANPCKHCDRSYGHKDNLRKHMKKCHPEFLDR